MCIYNFQRVAAMANVSVNSVTKIWRSVKNNEGFTSVKRKRTRSKPITGVDDATQVAIRNTIYQMYENRKCYCITHLVTISKYILGLGQHITLKTLRERLTDFNIYTGSQTSLATILKSIGFKWKKDDPRRGLMELPHVVLQRMTFLKLYHQYKEADLHNFVFLDETWIFQNGTIARSWQDADLRSVKSTKVDGKRLVFIYYLLIINYIDKTMHS